jgi:hypothetical protein
LFLDQTPKYCQASVFRLVQSFFSSYLSSVTTLFDGNALELGPLLSRSVFHLYQTLAQQPSPPPHTYQAP